MTFEVAKLPLQANDNYRFFSIDFSCKGQFRRRKQQQKYLILDLRKLFTVFKRLAGVPIGKKPGPATTNTMIKKLSALNKLGPLYLTDVSCF